MSNLKLVTHSANRRRNSAQQSGSWRNPGTFTAGRDLGAGKTCLTQGIAYGLDIHEYTLSPSFVIMRELHGRLPLYHMDFYPSDNVAEISDLGLDDYLSAKRGV